LSLSALATQLRSVNIENDVMMTETQLSLALVYTQIIGALALTSHV